MDLVSFLIITIVNGTQRLSVDWVLTVMMLTSAINTVFNKRKRMDRYVDRSRGHEVKIKTVVGGSYKFINGAKLEQGKEPNESLCVRGIDEM